MPSVIPFMMSRFTLFVGLALICGSARANFINGYAVEAWIKPSLLSLTQTTGIAKLQELILVATRPKTGSST